MELERLKPDVVEVDAVRVVDCLDVVKVVGLVVGFAVLGAERDFEFMRSENTGFASTLER